MEARTEERNGLPQSARAGAVDMQFFIFLETRHLSENDSIPASFFYPLCTFSDFYLNMSLANSVPSWI